LALGLIGVAAVGGGACSAASSEFGTDDDDGGATGGGDDLGLSTSSGGVDCDHSNGDADQDGDGFTPNGGDCNDCDPNATPDGVEVVATDPNAPASDENCDGQVDEPFVACDDGMGIDDADPMQAARSMDLCTSVQGEQGYGVISAQYVRANGTSTSPGVSAGLVADFGVNMPRLGTRMLALSSGHARDTSDPSPCGGLTCGTVGIGTPPPNFTQDVPNCDGGTDINDDIALELTLRAPRNATGYSFEFARPASLPRTLD
jgi:hypothetical protein